MADYPALDLIERTALAEAAVVLDREAGLDIPVPPGRPWSPTCRWCATPYGYRLRHQVRRSSMRVDGHLCNTCDRTASDLHVPEGWL